MSPTVSSRGRSFLQALQDSHGDEDEELRDVDKLMEELENQSEGFRPESQWTQYRQNKVLEQYETWVKWANKLPPAITQDELDQISFPPPEDGDFTALFARVRRFLLFSAKTMTPRSNRHQHVSYPFIVQLGFTIVYWAKSKYKFRPGKHTTTSPKVHCSLPRQALNFPSQCCVPRLPRSPGSLQQPSN